MGDRGCQRAGAQSVFKCTHAPVDRPSLTVHRLSLTGDRPSLTVDCVSCIVYRLLCIVYRILYMFSRAPRALYTVHRVLYTVYCSSAQRPPGLPPRRRAGRYAKHAGSRLAPPLGGPERMAGFPPLQPADVVVRGDSWQQASRDVAIAGARGGWKGGGRGVRRGRER